MSHLIDVHWDGDGQLWYAVAREDIGLATEAATLDGLRDRVATILSDLLERPTEFDLIVHSASHGGGAIAAE